MRTAFIRTGVLVALLASLAGAGCADMGLAGENLPHDVARVKPQFYNTYDAEPAAGPVHYDGRDWIASGPVVRVGDDLVRPVPEAGENVFALATEATRHTRLYYRTDAGMVPLSPVPVRGEAPPAAEAEHR